MLVDTCLYQIMAWYQVNVAAKCSPYFTICFGFVAYIFAVALVCAYNQQAHLPCVLQSNLNNSNIHLFIQTYSNLGYLRRVR